MNLWAPLSVYAIGAFITSFAFAVATKDGEISDDESVYMVTLTVIWPLTWLGMAVLLLLMSVRFVILSMRKAIKALDSKWRKTKS